MNMLTLLYFVISKQPKNKRYPHNSIKTVSTANTTHQDYTSQGALPIRTLTSPNRQKIYFSSTSLLFRSIPEKYYTLFGFTTSDLNIKIHFKTTRRKRLRIPSRTNLRRYIFYYSRFLHHDRKYVLSTIHGFSTLAANNKPQIIRSKVIISIDRRIHRKNKFIIHSYENPIYDDQTCTPRPQDVTGPEKNRQTKHPDLFSP